MRVFYCQDPDLDGNRIRVRLHPAPLRGSALIVPFSRIRPHRCMTSHYRIIGKLRGVLLPCGVVVSDDVDQSAVRDLKQTSQVPIFGEEAEQSVERK